MEKINKLLKSCLKRKVSITKEMLVAFMITGSVSGFADKNTNAGAELSPPNITINNYGEQTGLELGDNSRARGVGSISTGRNGVAIGKNAVATGENETKETIERKLEENKQRLQEIADAKKVIADKAEELRLKQIRERETIEAGIRVEEIQKSKEKARLAWENKKQELATKTEESKPFFREYQAKIDDLNSRLRGLENLEGANFASEEGLSHTADLLKTKVERDTTLNLSHDFYLDYVKSYYKALGDLRENYTKYNKMSSYDFRDNHYVENGQPNNKYRYLSNFDTINYGFYKNDDSMDFSFSNSLKRDSFTLDTKITKQPTIDIKFKNIFRDTTNDNEYNSVVENAPIFKENFKKYFEHNNNPFLTPNLKDKMSEKFNMKVDYFVKTNEITYYQYKYEETKNVTWLDKKKRALTELEEIENKFNSFVYKIIETTAIKSLSETLFSEIEEWKKENIVDIEEKNKLTTNRLTSELEQALGINKNAVLAKERELANLENEVDQAKRNYEGLNPTESDMILAREYQRVKEEINRLTTDLKNAEIRKDNLEKALTLYNLKNVGENQIAFGTDTLAVGNNSIAMGYKAITVGTDSVNIGARGQATGTSITQLGQDLVTNGNNNISIGNTNVINGENNIVFGRNNNVGALGDANKSNGNIVLGSGITVSKDVTNSITLGDSSTPVSNAISVGSANNERQIKNVKDATDDQDAVTYKQLKDKLDDKANKDLSNVEKSTIINKVGDGNLDNTNGGLVKDTVVKEKLDSLNNKIDSKANASDLSGYIKKDGSNITTEAERKALATNLTSGASLETPKGILVTDTLVKQGLDGKLNKDLSNLDETKINEKLAKGNITSTDITVTGGNNSTFKDVTLELSTALKDKINSVDDKANKDEVYTKDQTNTKIDEKINAIDLSGFAKTDASNIQKDKYTTKLSEDASLTSPTGALVTDTLVKQGLDDKADKNLSNVDKNTIITKVGDGNLDNTNGGLVKDTVVKEKLDNLKNDIDTKLNNKANASDLGSYLKLDGTNADSDDKRIALASKLSENSSLTDPKGILVTDTLVKQGLDGKLNKDLSNLDETKINEKLAKGNITSTDITVTGGDNSTFKNVTLNLSEALKNKINSVDDKLNKKGDNLTNDEKIALLKNLGLDNIPTVANLDNKLNKNGDNLEKEAFTTNLTKGANIDTPTNTVVTDKMVKDKLDSMNTDLGSKLDNKANKDLSNLTNEDKGKARTNLDVYSKSETDNKLNEKADKSDLTKYVKLDGSNIDKTAKDKLTEKLSEAANLDTPTNTLVTDTIVKTKLDNLKTDLDNKLDKKANASDVYTKNELDAKLKNTVAPKAEGDILSDTLEITNGKDRLIGKEDVKIELKDKSVSKEKLSDELTKNIDNKANINGNNIVNKKDKEDFRNNIDVYSKNEIDSKISNISTETNLDGEVKENEEKGVKGKVIDKHLKENYVHKSDIANRDKMIISNYTEIQENKKAIENNAREIKRVDAKINKVAALSQATASLDWGQISVGNVGVGASIAQYSNETGIAVGVAYRPTDNFFMNMKWTGLAGEPHYNSIGASATYQFNFK